MSSREKRMQEDIQAVISACKADPNCPFRMFETKGDSFSFMYTTNGKVKQFTFHLSDDYPEHTVVFSSDKPNDSKVCNDTVPIIFNSLARELYREIQIPSSTPLIPAKGSALRTLSNPLSDPHPVPAPTPATVTSNTVPVPVPVPLPQHPVERLVSVESQGSCNDCNSELTSDDYDDYDYYNDVLEDSEEEDLHIQPVLNKDMETVHNLFGEKAISHRLFGTIDDIDIELKLPMSFLDPEIAKAWKVIREEPLVVRLHLSVSRYLDATEPRVEVFQPSQKEKFGVGSQLRKILESFVSSTWKNVSNEAVQKARAASIASRTAPPRKKFHAQLSNDKKSEAIDDHSLARIVDMGFSTELARNALIITRGNVEEALNLLLSSPDSCQTFPVEPSATKAPRTARQNSYPKTKAGKKFPVSRQHSGGTGGTGVGEGMSSGAGSPLDDLNLLPSSTQSGKNAKQVPTLEHGFLVQVMQYVRQRLPTLNEYCVVCDEPHVFQNGAMLKPAVCARELCVFAFQTLGVMSDAAEDIATGAEVVDLLIAMCNAACRSHRKDIILDPFPTVVDPKNTTELALHPKKKDYRRVEKCLDAFLSVPEMTSLVGSELKKDMDQKDYIAYALLQWIITSNRSHIVKLPPEKQIAVMHTPHQFLLMSSPPAKEAIFRAARAQYGSAFAFHGSHIENWHSIMRLGLINASGTKHQMHGAAYGNGIYLSPHASVSFGYSGMGYGSYKSQRGANKQQESGGSRRFLNSKNLTCIALCEVITSKELKKNGNIWVMPNPDHVCTRFFFVYEDGQVGDSNIDTTNEKYKKEIMKSVGYQTG